MPMTIFIHNSPSCQTLSTSCDVCVRACVRGALELFYLPAIVLQMAFTAGERLHNANRKAHFPHFASSPRSDGMCGQRQRAIARLFSVYFCLSALHSARHLAHWKRVIPFPYLFCRCSAKTRMHRPPICMHLLPLYGIVRIHQNTMLARIFRSFTLWAK